MAKIELEMEQGESGVVVFDGTGLPLYLMDSMEGSELADLLNTLSLKVLATRLRFWLEAAETAVSYKRSDFM
jgi:hypothetical protein